VVQIALSIVLLVAAGLSIDSVRRVERIPLGFDPSSTLLFTAALQNPRYDAAGERTRFAAQLLDRVRAVPAGQSAGAVSSPPLRCCSQWALAVDGHPTPHGERLMVTGGSASPGYFATMGIDVVRGRDFAQTDGPGTPPVIVINETFAEQF